ncbi:hypothetical protein LWC35_20190 [Pseudonocardia kujensis]|uniref:hypothetical protein n=1 Tax=Pseudonocardia kujensis TaxID=1128675 RepID=UPI001E50FAB2|nr:hypothetical protein [Pseudonocardia kujensis]MCE0765202.1 hypothetical protein [Pseudonocardia kujensis]
MSTTNAVSSDPVSRSVDTAHSRPEGASDELVAAAGKFSEMLERIERARGALYEFHQLMGGADAMLDDVVEKLRECGQQEWAERIETELIGRNAIEGRWSFQIVEDFDDNYYSPLKDTERALRDDLMEGRRHVFEAEMKQSRRTHGHPHHTATPDSTD